jgi:hypothetical protein
MPKISFVSGLFIVNCPSLFGLLSSSLCPRLPISLDCPLLITLFVWFVVVRSMPKVAYVSRLSIVNCPALFGLLSSGLCPRLPISLDCPLLIALLCLVCCRPVYAQVSYVSRLSIVNCPALFGLLSSSLCPRLPMSLDCPLLIVLVCLVCCRPVYAQGCLCLWTVHC